MHGSPPVPILRGMKLRTLENRAFLAVVILVTVSFLWMVRPFLMPVFWAAVLAVLFHGVYKGFLGMMPRWPNTAAILTVFAAVVVVILPLVLLGIGITNEVIALYHRLEIGAIDLQAPIRWIEQQLPVVGEYLQRFDIEPDQMRQRATELVGIISQFLAGQALVLGRDAIQFAAMFFLMLYVLFFFVRDGERLVGAMIKALPLGDAREERLFERFVTVSRATTKGTLIVAAVQGALGGVLLWIVGIQGVILWGVLMAILALLPVVGTIMVWGPAAIYLISVGQVGSGIFVLLGGFFVVSLIDNFLRPRLIGRDTRMPDYLVLISTLGGLVKFGLSGFVAGPMLGAFFLVSWEIFVEEFSTLDEPGADPGLEPDPDVVGPGQPPLSASDVDCVDDEEVQSAAHLPERRAEG
jgi:predicted PurR-regulated permease PerM